MPGTPSLAARWPTPSAATRWSRRSARKRAKTRASRRSSPNGAAARGAPGCAARSTARRRASTLLVLRVAIIGFALLLWSGGQASAGDITFVLTSFFLLQGYLRDVGMHIRNLQRSVNDMEELVDIQGQPLGVADRPGAHADPHRQGRHRVRERDVPLRQPSAAALPRLLGVDPSGRAGRAGRPFRLRQDDLRQADPAAL